MLCLNEFYFIYTELLMYTFNIRIQYFTKHHGAVGFPGLNHLGTLVSGLRPWDELSLPVRFIPFPFFIDWCVASFVLVEVDGLGQVTFSFGVGFRSFTFCRIPQSISERSTPTLLDSEASSSGFRYRSCEAFYFIVPKLIMRKIFEISVFI